MLQAESRVLLTSNFKQCFQKLLTVFSFCANAILPENRVAPEVNQLLLEKSNTFVDKFVKVNCVLISISLLCF